MYMYCIYVYMCMYMYIRVHVHVHVYTLYMPPGQVFFTDCSGCIIMLALPSLSCTMYTYMYT